ncbi:3-deoxy-D-manno-octulosonate 8-phosphate phosphatase [hydrothermal vent metagenome]|uniref:3-deoxy-D-manno-octulosonate 8-phosphate phosphatase n=1 Tax=hydrothermal vent metagenome TaxID=652676 RepID=A0A3B0YRZ3_9ZZZZ
MTSDIYERALKIKLVIFDVDGVLTNGSLSYGHNGQESKVFHVRDGQGMKMLQQSGVMIAIITARSSQAMMHRMTDLDINHIYQGQSNKRIAFEDLCTKLALQAEQVAYVGDDLIDLPVMTRVGLAIATADAHDVVVDNAHWQTSIEGGAGAAREVCEFIMKAQGTFDALLAEYLS